MSVAAGLYFWWKDVGQKTVEYKKLMSIARRQFGQYKRYRDDLSSLSQSEQELVFESLYKPIKPGRAPSDKNIEALKRRIKNVTKRKMTYAIYRVAPELSPSKKTLKSAGKVSDTAIIMSNIREMMLADMNFPKNGFATERGETITKALDNFFDSVFNRIIQERGEDYLKQKLGENGAELRRKIARAIAVMYEGSYRIESKKIDKLKAIELIYDILDELGLPKSTANGVIKILNEELKDQQGQTIGVGITRGLPANAKKG